MQPIENESNLSIQTIQPQQYQSVTKSITIKIIYSKGTTKNHFIFNGDDSTTMKQLIAHIKWELQQRNITPLNGSIKDGRMKDFTFRFTQTLLSLKLNRSSLNYVLPK